MTQCTALETGYFNVCEKNFEEELPTVDITLTHLTTFSMVLKALTLIDESKDKKVLLPKLGMLRIRTCYRRECEPFAVVAFVEMIASRSPSSAAVLGVVPLREIGLGTGIPSSSNTLKANVDAALEQWAHKTDIPHIHRL